MPSLTHSSNRLCQPSRLYALPTNRQHYGLAVDYFNVYELDSSTEAKHSRHLLLRLPGHAFSNNHAMGKFVAQVRTAPAALAPAAKLLDM